MAIPFTLSHNGVWLHEAVVHYTVVRKTEELVYTTVTSRNIIPPSISSSQWVSLKMVHYGNNQINVPYRKL